MTAQQYLLNTQVLRPLQCLASMTANDQGVVEGTFAPLLGQEEKVTTQVMFRERETSFCPRNSAFLGIRARCWEHEVTLQSELWCQRSKGDRVLHLLSLHVHPCAAKFLRNSAQLPWEYRISLLEPCSQWTPLPTANPAVTPVSTEPHQAAHTHRPECHTRNISRVL